MTQRNYFLRKAGVPPHQMGIESTFQITHAADLIARKFTVRAAGQDGPTFRTQEELFDYLSRNKEAEFELVAGCYHRCYGFSFENLRCLQQCEAILGPISKSWIIHRCRPAKFYMIFPAHGGMPDLKSGVEIHGVGGSFVCDTVPVPGNGKHTWDRHLRPPHAPNPLSSNWVVGLEKIGSAIHLPPAPRRPGHINNPPAHCRPIRY